MEEDKWNELYRFRRQQDSLAISKMRDLPIPYAPKEKSYMERMNDLMPQNGGGGRNYELKQDLRDYNHWFVGNFNRFIDNIENWANKNPEINAVLSFFDPTGTLNYPDLRGAMENIMYKKYEMKKVVQ